MTWLQPALQVLFTAEESTNIYYKYFSFPVFLFIFTRGIARFVHSLSLKTSLYLFLEQFKVHRKPEQVRESPYHLPQHLHSPCTIYIPHQSRTFVTKMKPLHFFFLSTVFFYSFFKSIKYSPQLLFFFKYSSTLLLFFSLRDSLSGVLQSLNPIQPVAFWARYTHLLIWVSFSFPWRSALPAPFNEPPVPSDPVSFTFLV